MGRLSASIIENKTNSTICFDEFFLPVTLMMLLSFNFRSLSDPTLQMSFHNRSTGESNYLRVFWPPYFPAVSDEYPRFPSMKATKLTPFPGLMVELSCFWIALKW